MAALRNCTRKWMPKPICNRKGLLLFVRANGIDQVSSGIKATVASLVLLAVSVSLLSLMVMIDRKEGFVEPNQRPNKISIARCLLIFLFAHYSCFRRFSIIKLPTRSNLSDSTEKKLLVATLASLFRPRRLPVHCESTVVDSEVEVLLVSLN